jgi:DNA-binding FadR family transcriptional regulator
VVVLNAGLTSEVRKEKLGHQVTKVLARRIIDAASGGDGGLIAPTEREICEKFTVSKTVAREVIAELGSMNLVSVRHGRRMALLPESKWNLLHPLMVEVQGSDGLHRLVSELFDFRLMVEPEAAARAAVEATDAQRSRMGSLLEAIEKGVEAGVDYSDYDVGFHQEIVASARNRMLSHILDSVRDLMQTSRRVTSIEPSAGSEAVEGHRAVYRAIVNRDPEAARRAMQEHLMWGVRRYSSMQGDRRNDA